jgi:Putative adhesin
MNFFAVLLFVFAATATAQDKVTVPLSDGSQPATVKARLISGSITVTVGTGSQVVVQAEAAANSGREPLPPTPPPPPGMHRIDGGRYGFTAEEDHNVVTIGGGLNRTNLTIQVPANSSLELRSVNGGQISVTGVNGNLDVENVNGSIELKDVSGTVLAHTVNGSVTVGLTRVTSDKPMSFSSLNGKVDVTLPADTKARLHLKTTNGEIFSDFDVKMEPDTSKPVIEDSRGKSGRYRIRPDRGSNMYGSINGGGPEYSFQTMNGTILIHRK